MLRIVLGIALLLCIVCPAYINIRHSTKKLKRVYVGTLVLTVAIGLFSGIGFAVDSHRVKDLHSKYSVEGDSLFGEISCIGKTDEHYLFSKGMFLSGPIHFAIPIEQVEYLNKTGELGSGIASVLICTDEEAEADESELEEISVGSVYFNVRHQNCKIATENRSLYLLMLVGDLGFIILSTFIVFIINIIKKLINKGKLGGSEDEKERQSKSDKDTNK